MAFLFQLPIIFVTRDSYTLLTGVIRGLASSCAALIFELSRLIRVQRRKRPIWRLMVDLLHNFQWNHVIGH
jgi:hypothetical protein